MCQKCVTRIYKLPLLHFVLTWAGLHGRPKWQQQKRQNETLMQPVWSMCLWLCAHRFSSSAYQTCPTLTQCTSILWNGSLPSSWLPLPTLREQVESSATVYFSMHCGFRMIPTIVPVHITKIMKTVYDTVTRYNCQQVFLDVFLTDTLENRIANINEFFTFSLYSNVCRSLFEKHKLMFAFLLCARIMMNENKIDMVRNGSFRLLIDHLLVFMKIKRVAKNLG